MHTTPEILIAADVLEDISNPACEILRSHIPEPRKLEPWELRAEPTQTAADYLIDYFTAVFRADLERFAIADAKLKGDVVLTTDDVLHAVQEVMLRGRGRLYQEAT